MAGSKPGKGTQKWIEWRCKVSGAAVHPSKIRIFVSNTFTVRRLRPKARQMEGGGNVSFAGRREAMPVRRPAGGRGVRGPEPAERADGENHPFGVLLKDKRGRFGTGVPVGPNPNPSRVIVLL